MEKSNTNEIVSLAQSLGLSLKTFCEVFDLNYDAVRKAVSGHQELSQDQLAQWLSIRSMVQRVPRAAEHERTKVGAFADPGYFEMKMAKHQYTVKKLEREVQQLEKKVEELANGIEIFAQLRDEVSQPLPIAADHVLMKLQTELQKLKPKIDRVLLRIYVNKATQFYFMEKEQQARQAAETPTAAVRLYNTSIRQRKTKSSATKPKNSRK